MLQTFEIAVREVAYWAVLATGCLCLISGTLTVASLALKWTLSTFSLYKDFLAFVRTRRRGR